MRESVEEVRPSTKEMVIALLNRLPDDITLKDIQYHLYVLEALEEAEQDVIAGRVFTHAKVKERLKKWFSP